MELKYLHANSIMTKCQGASRVSEKPKKNRNKKCKQNSSFIFPIVADEAKRYVVT